MAKSDFQKYAQKVDATWETSGFTPLDDGEYDVILDKCQLKQSKSQFWMLALTFKVEGGDSDGRLCWSNLFFENKNGWNPWQVKAFFEKIGYEVPEFDELEDVVEDLVGNLRCAVELKTDGEYQQMEIIEVLDDEPEQAPPAKPAKTSREAKADTAKETKASTAKPKAAAKKEPEPTVEVIDWATETDGIDDWSKGDCQGFAEDFGFELKGRTVAKMILEIKAWVQLQPTTAVATDDDIVDPDAEALYDFCVSSGVEEAEEGMDVAEMGEILKEYEFKEEEMTAEEVALLDRLDLGDIIERKKAAPAGRARRGK